MTNRNVAINHRIWPNESMLLDCCRCKNRRALSGDGLNRYDRASKVLLCRDCEKMDAYRAGRYSCRVPPVPTGKWLPVDWVAWIDTHGDWLSDWIAN